MGRPLRPDNGLTPKGSLPIMVGDCVDIGDTPLEVVLKFWDVDLYDYYHAPLVFLPQCGLPMPDWD